MPKFDPQHVTAWSGNEARLAVDEKGVPVVFCVPNWLRGRAHVRVSRSLHIRVAQVWNRRKFCLSYCEASGPRSACKSNATPQTRTRGITWRAIRVCTRRRTSCTGCFNSSLCGDPSAAARYACGTETGLQ